MRSKGKIFRQYFAKQFFNNQESLETIPLAALVTGSVDAALSETQAASHRG